MGDPKDEHTFIGPLITEAEAERLEEWIRTAGARGARLLCGGRRQGAILEPTLLEDVPRTSRCRPRRRSARWRCCPASATSTQRWPR